MAYHTHFDFDASLRRLLQTALRRYHRRYNDVPTTLVVHPNNENGIRRLLSDLDLLNVEIKTSSGCLRPEIWMQVPEGGQR